MFFRATGMLKWEYLYEYALLQFMSFVLAFPARLQEHKVFRSHLYILKLENFSLTFSDLEGKQNHFRIYDNYHLQKEETCSFTAMYYKELNTNLQGNNNKATLFYLCLPQNIQAAASLKGSRKKWPGNPTVLQTSAMSACSAPAETTDILMQVIKGKTEVEVHFSLWDGFFFPGAPRAYVCSQHNADATAVHLTPSTAQAEGWELSSYTLWEKVAIVRQ